MDILDTSLVPVTDYVPKSLGNLRETRDRDVNPTLGDGIGSLTQSPTSPSEGPSPPKTRPGISIPPKDVNPILPGRPPSLVPPRSTTPSRSRRRCRPCHLGDGKSRKGDGRLKSHLNRDRMWLDCLLDPAEALNSRDVPS